MTARWGCFWWRLGQHAWCVGGKERWRQEVAGVGCRFNCMQCDHVGLISLNAYLSTPGVRIHFLPSSPSFTLPPLLILSLLLLPLFPLDLSSLPFSLFSSLPFPSLSSPPSPSLRLPNGKICIQTCYHQLPVTPILVDLPQNSVSVLVTVQVGEVLTTILTGKGVLNVHIQPNFWRDGIKYLTGQRGRGGMVGEGRGGREGRGRGEGRRKVEGRQSYG